MLQSAAYRVLIRRIAMILLAAVAVCLPCQAQEPADVGSTSTAAIATRQPADLLPETLGGVRSTGETKQFTAQDLGEITGEKSGVFLEYGVTGAAARHYGQYRIEAFQTRTTHGAFGLFTFCSPEPVDYARIKGSRAATAAIPGGAILWNSSFFVRIEATRGRAASAREAERLSSAVADIIGDGQVAGVPTLPESLPSLTTGRPAVRCFLGPRALAYYSPHANEMFGFEGRAEAALARYDQKTADQAGLELLIVEYNTPQFAHDAFSRATAVVASLPSDEQNTISIKREGNYIVEAAGIVNHDIAQQLIDSVKYPYTVKWLKDPHSRHYDRFAGQKAAQIILSSFGIVGLLLMGAFLGGAVFGSVIFVRRRRRQLRVFSDAGGMLCLDIDQLCLGFPARMGIAGHIDGPVETGNN